MPVTGGFKNEYLKKTIGLSFAFLTLCITSITSWAQEFVFNRLSQADGLASNYVHCIWQDKQGFLWIGSDKGLQRYDGRHFFSPNANTGTNLPFAAVNQIVGDGQGRMWIRSGDIIGIFDPGSFRFRAANVLAPAATEVGEETSLQCNMFGQMYLVKSRNAVLYFNENTFSFDKKFTPYQIPEDRKVTVVFDDSSTKRTWLGTNRGLACYDWQSKQLFQSTFNPRNIPLLNKPVGSVSGFEINQDRKYWISTTGSKKQLLCYDEKTDRFTNDSAGIASNEEKGYFFVRHISLFSDSIRIAYGTNALQVFTGNRFVHLEDLTPAGTLQYESIEQVFEDREGIIWVVSDNGLYNLTTESRKATRFQVPKKSGLVFNAACQLPNGDILLYAFGRGLYHFNETLSNKDPKIIRARHKDPNYQYSWSIFSNTADTTVWMGCQFGRIIVYHPQQDEMKYYELPVFKSATMTRTIADKKGYLWIGLSNGDIFRWKQHSSIQNESFEWMCNVSTSVTEMFLHSDGNIYAGTRGAGAYAISSATGKIVKQFNTGTIPQLSTNLIGDLCAINDSVLCFTGDVPNIVNLKKNTVSYLTRYNDELMGEPNVQVRDKYGDIWFVTMNGIYRYKYGPGYMQKFTQWEGLGIPNNSIAVLERRLLRNGTILLAGNLNAMLFDPNNYRSANKPDTVLISNVRIGTMYQPLDSLLALKTVHLDRDQNSITISFGVPGFGWTHRNLYQYKLEGADNDWVNAADLHEARYSLLPPGHYTFKVRAQNEEGVLSEQASQLQFVIHPPFWKTWWFIITIIILAALIAYQVHRMRIRQLLRVEKVRSRLASDLHDDMGSTLSTINILSTIAISKTDPDNKEVKEYLRNISQSSSRVMEAMDDIVWSINPQNDSMQKLTARMREFASNTLEAKDIGLEFTVAEEVKELKFDMEARRHIFLLFKESVNNIIKYSFATKVQISLTTDRKKFIFRIRDNGKGFDAAAPVKETRGNGLRNMHARAKAVYGSVKVESQPGQGTFVELEVPLRR